MSSYIGLAPKVLAIPVILQQAKQFRTFYKKLQHAEGGNFPYMRLMGRGSEINQGNTPDHYYYALTHYNKVGDLGDNGNFVLSNVQTVVPKKVLDNTRAETNIP